ncbi:hypothetical protein A2392_01850 [Candidatus Kaiserbacteria bacterium RIFOXYB1_FULL_46_14]|uniref:LTD domain-containing protein n=1 Tax=Candidatus Kaiserbacteria bacterium RIFOXYB1_FULL_46_14 TaxID=1798531 RepID=A0A1F6FK02_9BACT|nr:MAG: hypothetical protein A2392_01850 [Candidatus Kaiserbacteria bacterium RIFOXYB1_FULL_46_14]
MNSHTAHFFNRVLSFMTIIALVLVMVPVWPQIANAATFTGEISLMPNPDNGVGDGNGEWFKIQNTGVGNLDLTGWEVNDGQSLSYIFGSTTLSPSESYVVCANASTTLNGGVDCDDEWGAGGWNNGAGGDTFILSDASSAEVTSFSYVNPADEQIFTNTFQYEDGSVPECSSTDDVSLTTFDTFATGTVNAQNSWSATGPYDQEVVPNTYGFTEFGCKSLRISNAVTNGAFGDQTFAAPTVTTAGESSVAANNHFEAQFDIASTMPGLQSGLALSVSPDDGNGSRMSYLSFTDTSDGIDVVFYDVTNAGPLPGTTSWNDQEIATLDRDESHTIKFVMDFVDGPANDIVKIYIDGSLAHTGTSWEDYYRYDAEQSGNGNALFPVDTLIFRAGGSAVPANDNKGFLFDNMSLSVSNVSDPETSETVVVTPGVMQGWEFNSDRTTWTTGVGEIVAGPATPPLGKGSARITTPTSNERTKLRHYLEAGLNISDIVELKYSTYRTEPTGGVLALALQFDVDMDGTPVNPAKADGRIVYEPYYTQTTQDDTWQEWDALNDSAGSGTGNWWIAGPNGGSMCTMSDPCTWEELNDNYPDLRISAKSLEDVDTQGAMIFKAGGSWAGFDGSVDKFVIGIDQGSNIHTTTYDFEPEPTSNVTMCKYDQSEVAMGGWTLMLKGEHVEDLVVPANTAMGTTTVTSLEAGKSYIAVATGVWLNDRNPDNHVDAEYSTEDNWLTQMDGFTGYGEDILDLQVAEDFVEWGSYNSNHTYATSFTPDADGTVNFRIFDGTGTDPIPSWYNDNSGSLNVSIYEGYAGVTGEGCVTFEGVPYGEYEADEVMQAGWWHLDGQGVVSVNEENENFSIFNTDEEPVDPGLVITNPATDYEVLSESHTFLAEYIDADVSLDPVQWAIRAGTCSANTNTVAGNVDGFSTPFSWNGADFSTTIDMSAWSDGDYCLVVNPTEDGGENFRESRWFTLENPVVVSCIAETNLLANASFEEPAIDGQWEHISDPVDWVVKKAGDTGTALMEIIRGYSGWLAADGEQFAELDSDESTRLIQTIPTIEDKEYTLSWAFSPRPGLSTGNNQMEVFIDGDEVASNQADGTANTNTDWETHTYSFVGDGNDVEVTFADATPSDGYGALLDNVSLTCNPDTGTINYCGDEEVNGYEQCELGDEGCNTSCQLANQCHEDKLVKITLDDTIEASGSWNGKVYLGDSNKIAPNGYWFSVDEIGEASAVSLASAGFKGLALDFDGAKMKFAWRGENPSGQIDYIKGNLAFQGFDSIVNDDVVREINGTGFKLENPGQGFVDVFQTTSTSSLVFDMRADTGNDGATLTLRDGVMCEEDIPDAETYEVFGFVWRDENEDTVKNEDENYRAGVSISITNGTTTVATTTDASGRYSFEVEAGSWTVIADIGSDWDYTYPDNIGHSHSVSVVSSDTGPYDFGTAEDNSSSRNTNDNNGGDGDGNGGDGNNGGDGGGDGVGGGDTTIDGTGATPQVAGASTGNFGSGEGDGDTGPDGKVLGESTSTDNDVDDSTEETASSSKAVAALVDWIDECWYWWLMVLTWIIASGAVYYWKGWSTEAVSVMSVSFIFGILGLLGLIFYFVLGTECALWPSLITTIGAALLYYINSLEVPPTKPVL